MSGTYRYNRDSVRAFRRNRRRSNFRPQPNGKPKRTTDAGAR